MKTNNSKTPPRGVILFFAWSFLALAALCLGRVVLDARLAVCGVIADGVVTKIETNTTYTPQNTPKFYLRLKVEELP